LRRKREETAYERAEIISNRAANAARNGKLTGLDNFVSDDDSEDGEEDDNVDRVVRRHDFDDELDDHGSDDEQGGDGDSNGGSRTMSVRARNQCTGRVSTSPAGNDNLISSVSERTVELERDLKAARDEIVSLKGELEGMRRRHEIMTQLKDSPEVAIADPLYKNLDKELKGIIRRQ
jgi:hypothetical protein